KLTETELCEIVNLISINNFIVSKEEENDDNDIYDIDQNSSIRTTLILEDI
ncbi:672_t:CDS:1, partial [Racocetra persica]